ncbi:MAG: hypothetical protein ACHQ51_06780 [Elusimicrobiota bacterium]
MRNLILLLLLYSAPSPAAAAPAPLLPAGLVIASIKIESHNVFHTEAPPENKLIYRAANDIHVRTRDPVIMRELLFEVGDDYDPLLIEETERNLRALPFIRRAEITATVNDLGTVDVVVRTYDSWTLEVVASFKRGGGSTNIKTGIAEHNIMGEGKAGSAVFSRDGTAQTKSFGYQDVQFLHYKRLQYSATAVATPVSKHYSTGLIRPFYASIAPSAYGATLDYVKGTVATYDAGGLAAGAVAKTTTEAELSYGVAFATSTERTRRIKFGVLEHHANFEPIPGQGTGPMPNREQLGFLKVGAELEELDFLTVRRIQKFTHDEDYNLGLGVFPTIAWAPAVHALGTTGAQFAPAIVVKKGFTWSDQLLLLNSGYSSRYVNGGNTNRLASFNASYFVRGLKYQTFAFHSGLDLGWHLDPDAPLVLGDINGLRGYGLSQFTGNRRFLFNIEDRIFVWDELLRVIDVGTVAFYDSGYVWPASSSIKLGDLKNSMGLGLRLAPSRSSGNDPVRIDLAYALSSNQSRSRFSLSIQAGQAF